MMTFLLGDDYDDLVNILKLLGDGVTMKCCCSNGNGDDNDSEGHTPSDLTMG